MDKRVTLEMRGKSPDQIKELVLDNCRSTSISGITDEFCNLEKLSLSNIGLTTLKGFPKLPNLKKLELSDNRISGGLENIANNCPKLKSLYLSGNKIDNLETLEPLKSLSTLEHLDLQTCKVTLLDDYEEKVFAVLPQLKYLDGFDQNGAEAEESDVENSESKIKSNDKDGKSGSNSKHHDKDSEDDSDLDEEDDEDEEGSSEEDVGLDYLMKNQIDEESEENDYHPDDADSDADDIIDSDEEESPARGQKRKLENDE